MKTSFKMRGWSYGLGVLGAFTASTSVWALDLPKCAAGEYLWLVTAGNPSGTLMPKADMRVSTVTFQDWTDGSKTLRTANFTNVPKGKLGAAKTFERYSGGGNLGWFAKSWPTAVDGYAIEKFKALTPRNPAPTAPGGEYPTDFASSRLIDGLPGQTLAQVLSSPSFDGRLTYVAPAQARIDFVTIALCTSALPTPPKPTPSPSPPVAAPAAITPNAVAPDDEQARIAARIKALQESARAEENARRIKEETDRRKEERLQQEQAEAERAAAQKLEEERLEAELLRDKEAAHNIDAPLSTVKIIETPQTDTKPAPAPKSKPTPSTPKVTVRSNTVKAHIKRDMIMSGTMAAAAMLNVAVNALGNMMRAAKPAAPTPASAPTPAPPAPTPSKAGAGGMNRGKKKEKGKKPQGDLPDSISTPIPTTSAAATTLPTTAPPSTQPNTVNTPKRSNALSSLQTAEKGVLFPNSLSQSGQIPDAPAAVDIAYAAVGRIGYPHAPRAARDAMDLGFGSAVLIRPNKVLTNYHVWTIIKDMPGIGVEFEARENNEVSEFITLENNTPEILNGIDAVVLTLSRQVRGRAPIWPKDIDYADPDLIGREIYAIGHPVKPEDESWLMKNAVEDVFESKTPLWNVKRYSVGPIVKHNEDRMGDILFEVPVRETINASALTPALCHRASTLGGNSGGAIIDTQTGDFLGLHFGGQYWKDEDVNYAVPGRLILKGLTALGLNTASSDMTAALPKDGTVALKGPEDEKPVETDQNPEAVTEDITDDLDSPPAALNIEPEPAAQPNTDTAADETQSLTDYISARGPNDDAKTNQEPDDLTLIEGIGPKTAEALRAAGVSTFKALSQGSPYDLLPLLEAAGLPRRDPTTWPAQAALAAEGDWDKLETWQDLLHGGVNRT